MYPIFFISRLSMDRLVMIQGTYAVPEIGTIIQRRLQRGGSLFVRDVSKQSQFLILIS